VLEMDIIISWLFLFQIMTLPQPEMDSGA